MDGRHPSADCIVKPCRSARKYRMPVPPMERRHWASSGRCGNPTPMRNEDYRRCRTRGNRLDSSAVKKVSLRWARSGPVATTFLLPEGELWSDSASDAPPPRRNESMIAFSRPPWPPIIAASRATSASPPTHPPCFRSRLDGLLLRLTGCDRPGGPTKATTSGARYHSAACRFPAGAPPPSASATRDGR